MRVCFVSAWLDFTAPDPRAGLERMPTVRAMAREQQRLGHDVTVVLLARHPGEWREDGVHYRLAAPSPGAMPLARAATRLTDNSQPARYLAAPSLARAVAAARPDVVHFFGLTLDFNLAIVARAARRLGIPLIVQFHGGAPARRRPHRALQRRNLRHAARVLFSTVSHAEPWLATGLVRTEQAAELLETSSDFRRHPRDEARLETGLTGHPVLLWTGRLHEVKDPLTALRGFERVLPAWPCAQLYLYYLTAELLPEIESFLASRPALAARVHLGGRASHDRLEAIYNSADIFLQASQHEVAGIAVLEALACGVLPIVTDIPSFRAMTCEGEYGGLFTPGDDVGLAEALLRIDLDRLPALSAAARAHFDAELSFPAQACRLEEIYRQMTSAARVEAAPRRPGGSHAVVP